MKWLCLVLMCAGLASAETPDVTAFLREVANALSNGHDDGNAQQFLDSFDHAMPGYADVRNNVEALVARSEVSSAIEVVSDAGDERKRVMELDWVLEVTDQLPRRKIVKVTIEKRGKHWKFTSLEPADFFKY